MARKKKIENDFAFGAIENSPSPASANISSEKIKEDYLEILYYQTKQKNNLLGSYDSSGKYTIKDLNILKNLITVSKKFEDKTDNIVYASAKKDNFVLNFKIELDLNVDFSRATLYLIEIEHGLEQDKKHVTKIDEYLTINSATFKNEIFDAWHIWTESDIYEKNDFLFDYLKFQEEEYLFNKELTEILSQLYLVRLLKILETNGELGQKILLEYKLMLEKMQEKDLAFKQSNTNLKEILDLVILKNEAFDIIFKNAEACTVATSFVQPLKRIKDKIPATLKEVTKEPEQKKEEKKKEAPKKAKSKGKAKSKSSFKPFKFDAKKAYGDLTIGDYKLPTFKTETPFLIKIKTQPPIYRPAPTKQTPTPQKQADVDVFAEVFAKGTTAQEIGSNGVEQNAAEKPIDKSLAKNATIGSSISAERLSTNKKNENILSL